MRDDKTIRQESLRVFSTPLDLPGTPGTTKVYFGVMDEGGFQLHRMWLVSGSTIVRSATDYRIFRPFVSVRGSNGTHSMTYLGTPVSTATFAVGVDTPFKCHAEDSLDFNIPKDSALGIEMITVLTPPIVRATLSVTVTHG